MKIGEKIKELRKKRGITQEQLAEKLGVSFQAVSKWENEIALPDITLVPVIAEFFGVTTDYLFEYRPPFEIKTIAPKKYEDVNEIIELIQKGKVVVLNYELVGNEIAKQMNDKIEDSIAGVIIKQIASETFVCCPPQITPCPQ